ncbi:MAG: 16S rRNA (uracil(1498)-N(3))-methyltransferase [Legionellaceae bacterium]|nr:16S rRNA (uracil(1498)-N(3))-methyltransferase [Legionellaceae bacterium]
MRTVRIYHPGVYNLHDLVELSEAESKHVARVLRMHPGDILTLFCGDNREYSAMITAATKRHVTVRIESVQPFDRESPCQIHLAQGIAKGDRMSFIIQKAVELGVASITPLHTQHGAVRRDTKQLAKKHAQWEAIAISACEQSGRNVIPTIHPPCSFDTYLETCTVQTKCLLDPMAEHVWKKGTAKQGELALLIGPEGGLDQHEIKQAKAASFQSIKLGPRILRTETATIAALSVLQALEGDL